MRGFDKRVTVSTGELRCQLVCHDQNNVGGTFM